MHPQKPTTNTLGTSCGKWGSWCGWLGGHLSERGRVDSPRTTTLTSWLYTTRWRVGTQRTTSSPPVPIQPNKDMGHLINTLTMGLQLGTPHINTLSGNTSPGKLEASFEQWNHEVHCVKDHCPRVSGQGRYCALIERDRSKHGPIYRPFH